MKREIHISTGIVGLVVASLEFYLDDPTLAISIFLITLAFNSIFHLVSEWNYYRRHNSVIASSQFLTIPGLNLLLLNILGPLGAFDVIFYEHIGIDVILTHSSLLALPFIIFFTFLMNRYYQRRYTGFVLKHKVHGPFKIPYFIHVVLITLVILSSINLEYFDLSGLSLVIIFVIQNIYYLILPRVQSTRYDGRADRKYFDRLRQPSRVAATRSPSSRSDYTPPTTQTRQNVRPSQREDRPVGHSVSTKPKGGYRQISRSGKSRTRSSIRNPQPSTRKANKTQKSKPKPSTNTAQLSTGIEVIGRSKAKKKGKITDKSKYLPSSSAKKDDLKCMVCYQDFDSKSFMTVLLCPSCKYPAHEDELHQWLIQSKKCPRCAKDIKSLMKKSISLEEREYARLIKNV